MQRDAVGDDLRGEEGHARDHQQEAVESGAAFEQRSPETQTSRCSVSEVETSVPWLY